MSDEVHYVEEAPESGKPYARQFQLWVETYDRATLEQFIAAVRGLAEGSALEADRSFTEAERAKREADRAKTMADSTATHNQNCATAVTTCTQLVQQAKTAELGANSAAGTAGGHAQTAQQAATAAQADAGRAQADAKRAKDEADRAQRIVDGFNPGTGGGGGYGHSELVAAELGDRAEPYLITKADLGKTIDAKQQGGAVWLGRDTGTATDMVPGDFCEVVVHDRQQMFVLRAHHGVRVETDGGHSLAWSGNTTIRIRKLGANHWHVGATAVDNTERSGNVILNYETATHITSLVKNIPNLARLRGSYDRADYAVRGAFWSDDGRVAIQQSLPLEGGNFDEWIRVMSKEAGALEGEVDDWGDLVGEDLVFVAEWVRTAVNIRYIYGALDYVEDTNQHKLYIGTPQRGPRRLVFEGYPADRYLLVRVHARENLEMTRLGLQVWFWDKLGEKMIFRLFVGFPGEEEHIFHPSTEGAPNLDDWEIFAQWSGPKAYTRYDMLYGRNLADGSYATLEEADTGWTSAQPWVVRPLDPPTTTEPIHHTDPSGKAVVGWIDGDDTVRLRFMSPASVTFDSKKYVFDTQIPDVTAREIHFGRAANNFCELYVLGTNKALYKFIVVWNVTAGTVDVQQVGFIGHIQIESVVGQGRFTLPDTRMPAHLLVVRVDDEMAQRPQFHLIYSGYRDYSGQDLVLQEFHDTNSRNPGGMVSWTLDNLVHSDLTVWGGWLQYTFHNGYWDWYWAIQTSDGIWLLPRNECSVPFEDDGSGMPS